MPAVLMHSLFPKFVLTPKFFQCVFTVKNVHCTQYLDPICALPTGKQDRLERLRRQKTKSESYLKPYHKGCNQQTPFFTSLFFYADWKKIYSPTFLRFAELMAQPTSLTALQKHIFTIQVLYRPEQKVHACLKTVSNAECGYLAST